MIVSPCLVTIIENQPVRRAAPPGTLSPNAVEVDCPVDEDPNMSTQTILIIVVLILLFGGGGWYWRRGR